MLYGVVENNQQGCAALHVTLLFRVCWCAHVCIWQWTWTFFKVCGKVIDLVNCFLCQRIKRKWFLVTCGGLISYFSLETYQYLNTSSAVQQQHKNHVCSIFDIKSITRLDADVPRLGSLALQAAREYFRFCARGQQKQIKIPTAWLPWKAVGNLSKNNCECVHFFFAC